jgi:cytochrome c-type biogenesis protein CcmH
MRNSVFAAVFGVTLLAATVARGVNPSPAVRSVGEKVVCLCGCVAILNQCPHQNCSTHDEVNAVIEKLLAEGKSEPEILQALAARYGTKILAAPPAKGFNVVAWVLPGLGLIFGLMIIVVTLRRLRKPATGPVAPPPAGVDPKVLAAMEEEMKTSGLGTRG